MEILTLAPKKKTPPAESVCSLVIETLEEHKAEDVTLIPLQGKSDIAHAMIIATGRSNRHVGALADYVCERLREHGVRASIEGVPACDWVLLDGGDVIVHLFRPEVRTYYNLEKMWGPPQVISGGAAEPQATPEDETSPPEA